MNRLLGDWVAIDHQLRVLDHVFLCFTSRGVANGVYISIFIILFTVQLWIYCDKI